MKTPEAGQSIDHSGQSTNNHNKAVIYCDGSGCRPDGRGSGLAWIRQDTGERHVERVDGLTNNQAEYRAILSALSVLPDRCDVQVLTDSQLVWSQVVGNYRVRHPELLELLTQIQSLVKKKELKLDLQWIRREQNLAGKLL
jgi:ribonuclease HI